MLKICGNSICKSLEVIYKECLSLGLFPLELKKGNIAPIHKKGDKQCLKKLPISIATSRLWENSGETYF